MSADQPVASKSRWGPATQWSDQTIVVQVETSKPCTAGGFRYETGMSFPVRLRVPMELAHMVQDGSRDALARKLLPPHWNLLNEEPELDKLPPPAAEMLEVQKRMGSPKNQSPTLGDRIRSAVQNLDHSADHHWTKKKKPNPTVVSEWLEEKVTASQIEAAAPNMTRRSD